MWQTAEGQADGVVWAQVQRQVPTEEVCTQTNVALCDYKETSLRNVRGDHNNEVLFRVRYAGEARRKARIREVSKK